MNPNINLHIDSIVLDGIDLAPGQSQLLQQAVASQLTTMLTAQHSDSRGAANDRSPRQSLSLIRVDHGVDVSTLGPQVASAIYGNMPLSQFGPRTANGGQS